jgi:hypothetical protein
LCLGRLWRELASLVADPRIVVALATCAGALYALFGTWRAVGRVVVGGAMSILGISLVMLLIFALIKRSSGDE